MSNETLALILAAVRKATREEVAKIEPDLARPLRFMVGEKGEKGDTGERGLSVIGPQGEQGPKGDKGDTGPAGKDGKDGVDGKQGPRGPAGKDGRDGQDGRGFASAKVADNGDLILVFADGVEINAGPVKGPKGDRGDRGPRGTPGSGGGESGGGAAEWGAITGTLSAQTDLQAALDAKQATLAGGSAVIDFGAAPGSGFVTQTVTDAAITASSRVKVWVQGTTADHNAVEHAVISGRLGLYAVPAAGSFTLYAETELRLTGDVAVIWEAA